MTPIAPPASRQPIRTVVLLALLVLSAFTACATNPVTGKKQFTLMSESQEIAMGEQMDPEARREFGVYEDPEIQHYVEDVGLRLARSSERPNLPWAFTVVDVAAINAFALPGGKIYITRGILAYLNNEAELAGVLGHEIGHVTARHAVEQYTRAQGAGLALGIGSIFFPGARPALELAQLPLGVLFLKYGRDDERQADQLGARYAAQNGWDPAGVAGMLTALARLEETTGPRGVPNWLATHPEPAERVGEVTPLVNELRARFGDRLQTNRDGYLRRIDGLVFGENPREGVVRGHTFLHPDLRFALELPEGWDIQNAKDQVVAQAPGEQTFVFLQLIEQPRGRDIEDVAITTMRGAGFRPVQGGRDRVNGLEAFIGTFDGNVQGLGATRARVGFIAHDRNVYRVAGLSAPQSFDRVAAAFERTIRSFRPLDASEVANIRPNRTELYTVSEGDTWQSIAQHQSQDNVKPSTLAIMNGYPPNEQPRPGDRIKIVVSS